MIRGIVSLSVKFRILIIGTAMVLLTAGAVQLRNAPVDAFPEFTPPQVQIRTEALGLSAAEVEQLITVPMEQDLLNGVAWLDQIRSESVPGLSSVDLIFEPGTDLLKARQLVNERLTQANGLPAVGTPPVMLQPLSSTSRVMMIGLTAKDLSLIDLSVLARWKIKPRLMGVPGVANVAIWGQRDRQLQVQVDPDRLRKNGVSLSQVIDTTGNALWVSPLTFVEASTPGTGGFIETSTQRFAIQHVLPITTAKSLAEVTVSDTEGKKKLRLGDVASVVEDHQPLIGDAVLDNGPGLMLVIEKFPGADTREVTKSVENALTALKPGLSGVTIDTNVYRPATFIQAALHNLGIWALLGLVLVIALLGIAFRSWRVALIGAVTIPLSLVAAAYVLYLRGMTFNLMVLAGLSVALAIVIDETVACVAEIRRRGSADVAGAALAVGGSTVYATLIVLLAALPIFALGGVAGSFSRPLVLSYALAVLASAVVALTVTPALAVMLLWDQPVEHRRSRVFDRIVPAYLRRPRWAYLTLAVLIVAGLAALPQLGSRSLLPAPQDRDLLVHWQAAPGISLTEMARITTAATHEVRGVTGVRDAGSHVGRALTSDQVVNVNSGELWVNLTPSADYKRTVAAIRRVLDGYPGLRSDLATYPQDRVNEVLAGTNDDLVVRVYGQDLDVLRTKAQEVSRLLSSVHGVASPKVQALGEEPTLEVKVDLLAAQRYGIKPGDVRRAAATYFSGLPAGNLYEEQKIFDVVVWSAPEKRRTPSDLGDLLIDTPSGGRVRLGDVAKVRIAPFPTNIRHNDTSRSIDVTANVRGRDLGSVVRDVKSRVGKLSMPLEYHAEVLGDAAKRQNEDRRVLGLALGALVGIFFLLQAAFRSWRLAILLFLTLPLACAGGVLTALFVGGVTTFGALLGLFAVLGIAARNGILLFRDCQRLEQEDGEPPGSELVLRATRDRAGPVLVTALATAVALLPLVFLVHGSGGVAGAEVLFPLAVVVLGGLVTSTLLSVLVLPALYLRGRRRYAQP
jgi:CzcA family heavy metal efflux pump